MSTAASRCKKWGRSSGTRNAFARGVYRVLGAFGLIVLLAACSDDSSESGDTVPGTGGSAGAAAGGSSADAGADSPLTPSSWSVHVEVVGKAADAPALAVLISREDGSQESVTETDATGKVDVEVPHLGSVTVFHSAPSAAPGLTVQTVTTYARVDEESTFRVEVFDLSGAPPALADALTFEVDPATLPLGTDRVVVQIPCVDAKESEGDPANPIVFDTPDGCAGATEYYAAALALDASGHALGGTILPHLPFATGAVTHTLSFDTAAFVELEPEIVPTDPATDDIGVEVWSYPPGSSYGRYPYVKSTTGIAHPVGSQKLTIPIVDGFFTRFELKGSIWHPDVAAVVQRVDNRFLTASTLPAAFSFDAKIARVASVTNAYGDALERPSVGFSLESGALASCVAGRLAWQNDSDTVTLWRWTQKVTTSGEFEVPALPASLVGYGWNTGSTYLNWGSGVSHLKQSTPCADFATDEVENSEAKAPSLPEN